MKLAHIKTKAQALAALRKLGWQKSDLQMARGAMSYRLKGVSIARGPLVTLSDSQFMVTGGGVWSMVSSFLDIGNLKANASHKTVAVCDELRRRGILEEDGIGRLALAVGVCAALVEDYKKAAEAAVPVPESET